MSFNAGAGCWVNIGTGASPPVRFLSWISPVRYGVELTMRRITADKHLQDQVLDHFGYTAGTSFCFAYLVGFSVFMFFFGWLIMTFKHKDI